MRERLLSTFYEEYKQQRKWSTFFLCVWDVVTFFNGKMTVTCLCVCVCLVGEPYSFFFQPTFQPSLNTWSNKWGV